SLSMPSAPLVSELWNHIVVWQYEQNKPVEEIAELAGCSEGTVCNILWNKQEYGQTTKPHTQHRGHPPTLNTGDIDYLSALLD
ncbi:hypothetical protein B0H14DRAFT_2178271, partial [Mycena olivaceomarginata]